MLKSQLGRLQVEADAEVPSTFSDELEWLTCKSLLAQILVDNLLTLAIDIYLYASTLKSLVHLVSLNQDDFEIDFGSFPVLEAEARLPIFAPIVVRLVLTVRLLGFTIA